MKNKAARRKFPRIFQDLQVVLNHRGLNHFIKADAVDLSLGGLHLKMTSPPKVGTPILIQFQIGENKEILELGGEIKWIKTSKRCETSDVGVEFSSMDSSASKKLDELINKILANQE